MISVAENKNGCLGRRVGASRHVIGFAVVAALMLSGCVSATAPALQTADSDPASALPDDPPVIEVAVAEIANATTPQGDTMPAAIVPELAPRDGNSPLLTQGSVMAFAASPETIDRVATEQQAVASIAQPPEPAASTPAGEAVPATVPGDREEAAKPAVGLFARLYANRRQRAEQSTRDNALQPVKADGVQLAGGGLLPGVRPNKELFSLGSAQSINGEAPVSLQLASAGSLGRLSPHGLATQNERVKVDCFDPRLVRIIRQVERHYGRPAVVTSGYRSAGENRRAGGARNSMHIECKAADIQVEGVSKWALAKYLRTVPGRGGVGTYCRTRSVHIDVGEQREWHHPCRRKTKRRTS